MPLRLLLSIAVAVLVMHQASQLLLMASGVPARVALSVAGIVFLVLPLVASLRCARIPVASAIRWTRTNPRAAAWGVLAFLTGAPAVLAVTARVATVSEPLEDFMRELLHAESPWEWLLVLLAAAVIPALTEEIAFRGFLQKGLETRFGRWPGILLASAAFGLIHGFTRAPTAFVLGVLLGWIASRTGSIFPTIFAHALINSLSIVLSNVEETATLEAIPEDIPWVTAALAAAISAFLWTVFVASSRQSDPSRTPATAPNHHPTAPRDDPPGSE